VSKDVRGRGEMITVKLAIIRDNRAEEQTLTLTDIDDGISVDHPIWVKVHEIINRELYDKLNKLLSEAKPLEVT
jgi:hypothetical protein